MNRFLLPLLIVVGIGSACVQFATAAPSVENANAPTAAASASDNAPANDTDRYCLRSTGTHLGSHLYAKSRDGKKFDNCVNASGRVYTREDLERTGTIDTADALRHLDPSIH